MVEIDFLNCLQEKQSMNQWANIILYIISTNTCAIKQKSNNTTKAT